MTLTRYSTTSWPSVSLLWMYNGKETVYLYLGAFIPAG
eukprot:CAMPEP_0202380930 /NCGR_PEP_ID=MMETSP1127-20130417/32046_1 /ASSEMBLY_ACC=CAM_ASM_000462 /TAXON_ID=3047 /ORGANISM="Dunaliella tertiolecta, Strain CCMP1320" /LENGTH=37 /DNA_ID= /DNA_START= /DNA_END= /DNA_ORIENTATION=